MRFATHATLAFVVLSAGCSYAPSALGHSHNDYLRRRPLDEALAAGMGSVEADVFLVDDELRVGHELSSLRAGRTLESLYLAPLFARFVARGGTVHDHADPLVLLVDIKAESARVWPHLRALLARYAPMLTEFLDDGIATRAVTVILSGDRPRRLVAGESPRLCAIDGRLTDLADDPPRTLVPLVSDSWHSQFEWKGFGPMPEDERERLRGFAARAHAQGRLLRLWAAPDTPESWRTQLACGVDLINTDRPAELLRVLREPGSAPSSLRPDGSGR